MQLTSQSEACKKTSEFALKLRKVEEKVKVMENLYVMFQIREAIDCSEIFINVGVFKDFANFTGRHLRWNLFLIK